MAHLHSKLPACANCHYAFVADEPDEFCPRCGQQNHEVNIGFGHVVEEFLEGVFHFDGKVFRTAGLLLFKPGQLTKRFMEGRRVPYVPPIRLYVFISFVFFALLSLLKGHSENDKVRLVDSSSHTRKEPKMAKIQGTDNTGERARDSVMAPVKKELKPELASTAALEKQHPSPHFNIGDVNFTAAEIHKLPEYLTDTKVDSVLRSKQLTPGFYNRRKVRALVHWRDVTQEEAFHQALRGLSIMLFLLMPLAALLLKAVYFRRHLHYISHLIFTVHVHCFLFVFIGLLLLLGKAGLPWLVVGLLCLVPAVYFIVALHTFYGQGWVKTVLKSMLLGTAYTFALSAALILVLMGGVLFF